MPRWPSTHQVSDGQSPEQPSSDSGSSDVGSADEEDLATLLLDLHCRYLLKFLRENDAPVSVAEVARHVVAELTDTTPESAPDDVQRRVGTWLHHGQLPALDDHGIVEFDPESSTVTLVTNRWPRP